MNGSFVSSPSETDFCASSRCLRGKASSNSSRNSGWVFGDGTEVDLNGGMDALDLEQRGLIGESLYPCGREAAEFLRQLVAGRVVTCYMQSVRGDCFVGETSLEAEMVRNGWAISDHSGTEAWEAI